jgi:hypothetical protein
MGRIQVVLKDETESRFREKLAERGRNKKGSISEEIERLIESNISVVGDYFLKQEEIKIDNETLEQITYFYNNVETLEKKLGQKLILLYDRKTSAIYTVCHVLAETLTNKMDCDVSIDPEFQSEFRANRELQPENPIFKRMIEDGKKGRQFSDIIIEYDKHVKPELPLKVLGGQHRAEAIKRALPENGWHGIRVYFNLDKDKRTELYIVSNTNIAVPPDLLDRLDEQGLVPPSKLRALAWEIGILKKSNDFGERKVSDEESDVPVKTMRTFVVDFYDGKGYKGGFDNEAIIPDLCHAGGYDDAYEKYIELYKKIDFLKEKDLLEAGRNFVKLHKKQFEMASKMDVKGKKEFRIKALTPSVVSSWAFAAGVLQGDRKRLEKLYDLPNVSSRTDPLNASAMAEARLEDIDPPTYRGLGTRSSPGERGRMLKLFLMYSASPKTGIDKEKCLAAIQQFHADEATAKAAKFKKKAF